jgi:hypothetical protein
MGKELKCLGSGGRETFEVSHKMWDTVAAEMKKLKAEADKITSVPYWDEGVETVAFNSYRERSRKSVVELTEEAIQYLEHRAKMRSGMNSGRPQNAQEYRDWVALGGKKYFPNFKD